MSEKVYVLNVYNTMTGQYELIQVTKEVFQTYRRTKWNIEDSTERFFKHETQMSALIGGENEGYERFHEFIDYDNHRQSDLQQSSGRTGKTKNENARLRKEFHHIYRQVFPLRSDRRPHLRQLRYPLPPRNMVKKWYQAHRVALHQPTGLRQEILQRFPHHYGGQATGGHRSSGQQV